MSVGLLLALLLGAVAWLTAGAMAVRSVSRIWLRHWAEQRLSGSRAADLYLERPQRLLQAAGSGTAVAVFVAGAAIAAAWPAPPPVHIQRLVVAALVLLLAGQVIPRAAARRWAVRLVPVLLPALRLLDVLLTPLHWAVARAVRLVRGTPEPSAEAAARDGLEDLLREGELEGVGQRDEIAIITGVVQFGEKRVSEVMTPRADVFALDAETPPVELARRIAASGYSRVPIYRGSLDDVCGMVHVFDVLKAAGTEPARLRPIGVAQGSTRCNEQLFAMLRERRHLAIVHDDQGHTVGLVTLEDLLEELVGEIRDEHDEPQPGAPAAPEATVPIGAYAPAATPTSVAGRRADAPRPPAA